MATTSKGPRWEILHSLWIAWTFTLGFFNWVAFFYIGIRARQRKWILWGLVYAIPFILSMAFVERPAFDGWVGDLAVALTLILGVISIIHAFTIRKEYLLRLEALQRSEIDTNAALRQRIQTEDQMNAGETTPSHTTGQAIYTTPSSHRAGTTEPPQASEPMAYATSQRLTIDLNNSSVQEIASLPGIGLIIAKRAASLRESRGGFRSVEDFGEALNLKPHVIERIKPLVSVSPTQQSQEPDFPRRIVDF